MYIPAMRWSRLTAVLALACCTALAGCDEGDATKRDDLEAAAAAVLGGGKDDKAKELDEKAAEERRQKRQQELAKQAEDDARLAAITEAMVKAPAKPSKTLLVACDALVVVYAEWVKAVYFDQDGFQLDFFDNKKKNLGAVKGRCAKLASIPAADCMVEVIKAVSAEDVPEPDRKLIQSRPDHLFDKCVEQFDPDKL